jgi:hypothetical protein
LVQIELANNHNLGLEGRCRLISFGIASDPLTDIALTIAGIASTETKAVSSRGGFVSSKAGVVSTNAKVALSHANEVSRVSIRKRCQSILS